MSVKSLIQYLAYDNKRKVEDLSNELLREMYLSASSDSYVHSNGVKETLLKLTGTLPISYQSATYNIPVTFWMPYKFPAKPPICFVTPTKDMMIKRQHKHVDSQGMIYHSYLSNWSQHESNLIVLATNISSVFGKDPPVFARPKNKPAPAAKPNPPSSYPQAYNAYNRSNQAYHANNQFGQPGAARPGGYQPPPPSYNQIQQPQQPAPPSYGSLQAVASANKKTTLSEKVSGHLQMEIQRVHQVWCHEINTLQEHQYKLKRGAVDIERESTELLTEVGKLEELKKKLETTNKEISEWLDAKGSDDKEVDLTESVKGHDTWSRQIIECCAKDSAIDDTLYSLDAALGDDRLKLKTYLRQVRKLSREQFFARALGHKIEETQKSLFLASSHSKHYQSWQHSAR